MTRSVTAVVARRARRLQTIDDARVWVAPQPDGTAQPVLRFTDPSGATHVESSSRIVRAAQRALEFVTVRQGGEHFTRRPLNHVCAAGFEIEKVQRFALGIVERLTASKVPAESER